MLSGMSAPHPVHWGLLWIRVLLRVLLVELSNLPGLRNAEPWAAAALRGQLSSFSERLEQSLMLIKT